MVRLRGLAPESDPQSGEKYEKVGRFVVVRLRGLAPESDPRSGEKYEKSRPVRSGEASRISSRK